MCYHASLDQEQPALEARYEASLKAEESWEPVIHANAYAVPAWPVVTVQEPKVLTPLAWGMIPHWVKTEKDAKKLRTMTINCRYETMFDKPSFRAAAGAGQRCLIPVTGFFEWHTKGKKKYPFYIHPAKAEIVSIAGIWDEWADPETGEVRVTYSMLTRPANELMAKIHNNKKRMPCLLTEELEGAYLQESLKSEEVLELLNEPYPAEKLSAYTISKQITSRTEPTNVPEVLEPFAYPDLRELDLPTGD